LNTRLGHIAEAIRELKYVVVGNFLPSRRFAASGA